MPQTNTTKRKTKANLKLVTPAKATDLRLGGAAPSEEMGPGKYLVKCETAWIQTRGQQHQAVFQYRIADGKFGGVALRQWITVANGGGVISPDSRYAQYCSLALGRPLNEDDPVADPAEIFAGRFFTVFVGYRKTERPGGGGRSSEELAMVRKDAADKLRVHEILSCEELP